MNKKIMPADLDKRIKELFQNFENGIISREDLMRMVRVEVGANNDSNGILPVGDDFIEEVIQMFNKKEQ